MSASQDLVRSVSKQLKYYLEIKRLEDGFDLSGPDQPRLEYPTPRLRTVVSGSKTLDRPVKHYFPFESPKCKPKEKGKESNKEKNRHKSKERSKEWHRYKGEERVELPGPIHRVRSPDGIDRDTWFEYPNMRSSLTHFGLKRPKQANENVIGSRENSQKREKTTRKTSHPSNGKTKEGARRKERNSQTPSEISLELKTGKGQRPVTKLRQRKNEEEEEMLSASSTDVSARSNFSHSPRDKPSSKNDKKPGEKYDSSETTSETASSRRSSRSSASSRSLSSKSGSRDERTASERTTSSGSSSSTERDKSSNASNTSRSTVRGRKKTAENSTFRSRSMSASSRFSDFVEEFVEEAKKKKDVNEEKKEDESKGELGQKSTKDSNREENVRRLAKYNPSARVTREEPTATPADETSSKNKTNVAATSNRSDKKSPSPRKKPEEGRINGKAEDATKDNHKSPERKPRQGSAAKDAERKKGNEKSHVGKRSRSQTSRKEEERRRRIEEEEKAREDEKEKTRRIRQAMRLYMSQYNFSRPYMIDVRSLYQLIPNPYNPDKQAALKDAQRKQLQFRRQQLTRVTPPYSGPTVLRSRPSSQASPAERKRLIATAASRTGMFTTTKELDEMREKKKKRTKTKSPERPTKSSQSPAVGPKKGPGISCPRPHEPRSPSTPRDVQRSPPPSSRDQRPSSRDQHPSSRDQASSVGQPPAVKTKEEPKPTSPKRVLTEGEAVTYDVIVSTGAVKGNRVGSKVNVCVVLIGEKGRSEALPLRDSRTNKRKFHANQDDLFEVQCPHLGRIKRVKIGHDCTDEGFSWYVEQVVVRDRHDRVKYTIACRQEMVATPRTFASEAIAESVVPTDATDSTDKLKDRVAQHKNISNVDKNNNNQDGRRSSASSSRSSRISNESDSDSQRSSRGDQKSRDGEEEEEERSSSDGSGDGGEEEEAASSSDGSETLRSRSSSGTRPPTSFLGKITPAPVDGRGVDVVTKGRDTFFDNTTGLANIYSGTVLETLMRPTDGNQDAKRKTSSGGQLDSRGASNEDGSKSGNFYVRDDYDYAETDHLAQDVENNNAVNEDADKSKENDGLANVESSSSDSNSTGSSSSRSSNASPADDVTQSFTGGSNQQQPEDDTAEGESKINGKVAKLIAKLDEENADKINRGGAGDPVSNQRSSAASDVVNGGVDKPEPEIQTSGSLADSTLQEDHIPVGVGNEDRLNHETFQQENDNAHVTTTALKVPDENSAPLERAADGNSPELDENSPGADRNSPELDENSPAADRNSPAADRTSPALDENFPTVDSPAEDRKSPESVIDSLVATNSTKEDRNSPLPDLNKLAALSALMARRNAPLPGIKSAKPDTNAQVRDENSPVRVPDESSSVPAPDENSEVPAPDENSPVQRPDESSSVPAPAENSPVAAPDENSPIPAPDENSPVSAPDENSPVPAAQDDNASVPDPDGNLPNSQASSDLPKSESEAAMPDNEALQDRNPSTAAALAATRVFDGASGDAAGADANDANVNANDANVNANDANVRHQQQQTPTPPLHSMYGNLSEDDSSDESASDSKSSEEKEASARDGDGKPVGEDLMNKKDAASELHEAARKGNVEQIKALSADNPDILKQKDERGFTGLHTAVVSDQVEVLKWLTNPSNVDAFSDSGYTALQLAAMKGHVECLEELQRLGARLNLKTPDDGQTALHLAAESGEAEALVWLIKAGAKLDETDTRGRRPLDVAHDSGNDDVIQLLLPHYVEGRAKDERAAAVRPS